jgi:hypothetical protein
VNVFARELSDDLASLVKQLDAVVGENEDKDMKGFVVLLTEDPDADEAKIKSFGENNGIKNLPLTLFEGSSGPPAYQLAENADVTIHMWVKTEVKVNHAFEKGDLKPGTIKRVVAQTKKILE